MASDEVPPFRAPLRPTKRAPAVEHWGLRDQTRACEGSSTPTLASCGARFASTASLKPTLTTPPSKSSACSLAGSVTSGLVRSKLSSSARPTVWHRTCGTRLLAGRPAVKRNSIRSRRRSPLRTSCSDQARARALLQEVLEEIPPDVRRVFVMVEIEEFALGEVAKIIGAPIGTVSSRLRRGRQIFEAILKRRRAVEGRGRKGERT